MRELGFKRITIANIHFPNAYGVMYAKPRPEAVDAYIIFPYRTKAPEFYPSQFVEISAYCDNGRWMHNIRAILKKFIREDGHKCMVTLYRNSAVIPDNEHTHEYLQCVIDSMEHDLKNNYTPGNSVGLPSNLAETRAEREREIAEMKAELAALDED